jgi:hypothetical protein
MMAEKTNELEIWQADISDVGPRLWQRFASWRILLYNKYGSMME